MNIPESRAFFRKSHGLFLSRASLALILAAGIFSGRTMAQSDDLNAPQRTITQIISLEDEHFTVDRARLRAGRDGRIYLLCPGPMSYLVSMRPDGSDKKGSSMGAAATVWATANKEGTILVAFPHFTCAVQFFDQDFHPLGMVPGFLAGDKYGFDSPGALEIGTRGGIFAMDQYRNEIRRLAAEGRPMGREIAKIPAGADFLAKVKGKLSAASEFRVDEARERFIWRLGSELVAVDWKGAIGFDQNLGFVTTPGAFDVDDAGNIYVWKGKDVVEVLSPAGTPVSEIHLDPGVPGTEPAGILDLRVEQDRLYVRRPDKVELFRSYDLKTGKLLGIVQAANRVLRAQFPGGTWPAGKEIPFTIDYQAEANAAKPHWRAWVRPWSGYGWTELAWKDGKLALPGDLAGLYQLRVNASVDGSTATEQVEALVLAGTPEADSTVSLYVPSRRAFWGRGEAIPFQAILKVGGPNVAPRPAKLQLRLGDAVVWEQDCSLTTGTTQDAVVPAEVTRFLQPGKYLLTAQVDGVSLAPQAIYLGPGPTEPNRFQIVSFADYGNIYPPSTLWNAADITSQHLDQSLRLGENLFVGRLGVVTGSLSLAAADVLQLRDLRKQLEAMPGGPWPEMADVSPDTLQIFSGYSAFHIEQMAILLGMDTVLPIAGLGLDSRPPDKLAQAINLVMDKLEPYPSFIGWSWAANWWVYGAPETVAKDDAQKMAYRAALKTAKDSGTWDDVIGDVAVNRYDYFRNPLKSFNSVLQQRGGRKMLTAASGPYRQLIYPPSVYENVDEVDLHYQAEQIAPPMVCGHNVAYQKLPGKRAWGHPENFNEDGRGDVTVNGLFQQLMWGADGTGYGGRGRTSITAPAEDDPRIAFIGSTSVARQFDSFLALYGPWTTGLKGAEPIAILVSRRMVDQDLTFAKVGGPYFDVLHVAWQAGSYCGRPAKYIFTDYAKDVDWKQFQAVLMIDQTVEPEPAYKEALASAQQAGAAIYYDGSCRSDWSTGAKPLGFAFDGFKPIASMFNCDIAYYLYTPYVLGVAAQLQTALKDVVKPIAESTDPAAVMTERTAGKGRFFFVLNQQTSSVAQAKLARVSIYASVRVPQTVNITVDPKGGVLYDVFARQQIKDTGGTVHLDLRDLAAGMLAVLPEPIASVRITPGSAAAGQPLAAKVEVLGDSGQPLDTSMPVYCTLRNGNGDLLEERFLAAGPQGVEFSIDVPKNLPAGGLKINALDLIGGKEASANLPVETAGGGAANGGLPAWSRVGTPPLDANPSLAKTILPISERFGPHVRSIALSPDGKTAMFSSQDFGDNVFAVDTATGRPLWSNRIGNWFAYQPAIVGGEFGAMGFDWSEPEGYFLYRLGADGQATQRFAVPGLARRLTPWLGPFGAEDNSCFVATPPDGKWIAASGNLGLMVWSPDGKVLWKQDLTKERSSFFLLAPNSSELWICDGMDVRVVNPSSGKTIWQQKFGNDGLVKNATTDRSGQTVALVTTSLGGRVLLFRKGKLLKEFQGIEELAKLSPAGDRLARIRGTALLVDNLKEGTSWAFQGDDILRNPAFSEDGRLYISSAMGTACVFQADGSLAWKKDLGALASGSWLPGGDLLVAGFMGDVQRLGANFDTLWETRLKQPPLDGLVDLDRKDNTPVTRWEGWSNAEKTSAPLTPNLLTDLKGDVAVYMQHGQAVPQQVVAPTATRTLSDGSATPPADPIIPLIWISMIDSGWRGHAFVEITFPKPVRIDAITFYEDPSHPESWLREAALEYYDKATDSWLPAGTFLSNQAVHTHKLATPVVTTKLRLVTPAVPRGGAWLVGNLRLGEIVVQGEAVP